MARERLGYDDASWAQDFIFQGLQERDLDGEFDAGMTFGSGLGMFPNHQMDPEHLYRVSFSEVYRYLNGKGSKSWPKIPIRDSKVKGHDHSLVAGYLKSSKGRLRIFGQEGREHIYEGVNYRRATFWLRVMQLSKVPLWIGSNAAGIITPNTLSPEELMAVMDIIDMTEESALVGDNEEAFGPRFPHMSTELSPELIQIAEEEAARLGIPLKRGIYFRKRGPRYERRDEVLLMRNICRTIWEEAATPPIVRGFEGLPTAGVGMSTAYETEVVQHARLSSQHPAFQRGSLVLSVLTNYSASLAPEGLVEGSNHEEVGAVANAASTRFEWLVCAVLERIYDSRNS